MERVAKLIKETETPHNRHTQWAILCVRMLVHKLVPIKYSHLVELQASNALKQRNPGRITVTLSILLSTYTNGVRRFKNSFIPYLSTQLS